MGKAWIAGTVIAAALISLSAGSVLAEEGLCRVAPQCPVRVSLLQESNLSTQNKPTKPLHGGKSKRVAAVSCGSDQWCCKHDIGGTGECTKCCPK